MDICRACNDMGHILDWHNLAPCDNDKDTHGSADFGIELIPSKERASTAYMGGRCVMAYEMNHHTVSTLILNTTKHTFQFFVYLFFFYFPKIIYSTQFSGSMDPIPAPVSMLSIFGFIRPPPIWCFSSLHHLGTIKCPPK